MNISSFTIQEKSELDWLLYERVPETMAALKSMKRHEYDMFAVAAVQNLNTHLQSLLNGKPKMPVKILPDGTNVKFQPGTLFPIYQSNNSAVTAALKKLGAAWAEANASDLSTEDRYTINAVVETYLPEAWQMVQKLADRPDPIKLKAEMMFLEQVQLMQQQVDAIVDSSTQSALSSIQAYTLFLKGKTAQPKSALSL